MDDARKVAQALSIPFYVLNFKRLFKEKVIEPFVEGRLKGETPNPCVICNEAVKFDGLLRVCMGLGADSLATGHYARVSYDADKDRYILRKGADEHKDQSYFLYSLTQRQLAHALFPLGDRTKEEARELCKEMGLDVHDKPESQDLCFAGKDGRIALLEKASSRSLRPGPILNREGKVIGMHRGAARYTVGQRRGLGLSGEARLYVVDIDAEGNSLMVAPRNSSMVNSVLLSNCNYVSIESPDHPIRVTVKTRYREEGARALLVPLGDESARLEFAEARAPAAPGQHAVFYDGDLVLGGGIIAECERTA